MSAVQFRPWAPASGLSLKLQAYSWQASLFNNEVLDSEMPEAARCSVSVSGLRGDLGMLCPVCEEGNVEEVIINRLEVHVYLCNECDAMWKSKTLVYSAKHSSDFKEFMAQKGLLAVRDEVTLIKAPPRKKKERL